jgi:hypothetical protein
MRTRSGQKASDGNGSWCMQIAGEHLRFFALFIYIYVFMRADLCKYARIVFMAAAATAAVVRITGDFVDKYLLPR